MLKSYSHPHIYGIDLASPSELIAHHRDEESIAKHIGAVKVIYQTLDDLKAACAELSPRPNQEFEVGVFCGSYITPVDPGYFEHLERIRGHSKKLKIVENARTAVANGLAGLEEIRIATNGVEVTQEGRVVPASTTGRINAIEADRRNSNGKRSHDDDTEADPTPKDRMDISLHNYGDYVHESR